MTSLLACVACGVAPTPAELSFPDGGLLATATPLEGGDLAALRGSFLVDSDDAEFPSGAAIHSTAKTISFFATRNAAYGVLRAGCLTDGRLVLEGTWRFATTVRAGLVRLFVEPPSAALELCQGQPLTTAPRLVGHTSVGSVIPATPLTFSFERPLVDPGGFVIVGHRGGCRTSDACGASENSLPLLRLAESLGASAVEIDIQLTQDGTPVLYHDEELTSRLTRGTYCRGAVADFTLAHLGALCRLSYGEVIPTLSEALTVAIEETELRGVWLDIKSPGAVAPTLAAVQDATTLAAARGRAINFVFGLWSEELIDAYLAASPEADTRCLVELEPRDLREPDCRIWAPRWTLGPMADRVARVQSQGRAVVFWTLDDPEVVDIMLAEAKPNGILTNRPGLVFHRFQSFGQSVAAP